MHSPNCALCQPDDTHNVLWRNDKLRVIDAEDPDYPGFTRVAWNDHVCEMTDLEPPDRRHIMDVVWLVEGVMRVELMPGKVNVAQLGNYVPHIHWHVIPRWPLDSRYPDAIWAPMRERSPEQLLAWEVFREQQYGLLAAYHASLRVALNSL